MCFDNRYKIVDFYKYCDKCLYKELDPSKDPCDECLTETTNLYSHKPVNFKDKGE